MYQDPIKGDDEPHVIKGQIYEAQAKAMEEELTMVLDERRKSGLPAALETFNKIQGKNLSTPSFNRYKLVDHNSIERENLKQLSYMHINNEYLN